MTPRTLLFFLLAISSGLLAAAGVTQMRSYAIASQIAKVVVVKKPISRGVKIGLEHLEIKDMPSEFLSAGMASSLEQVVGRVAIAAMVQGEFIMSSKVTSSRASAGIASLVPAGMRAKSISASNPADRVSGLLDVGDHVDILLTRSSPRETRGAIGLAETLLQNIEVLAIDRMLESKDSRATVPASTRGEPKSSSITLLVTPEQASLLSSAQREGLLSFSIRNPEDGIVVEESESTNRFERLAYVRKEEVGSDSNLEFDSEFPEDGSEVEPESEQSLTISDLQGLISAADPASRTALGFSAIRTIRGSRVGVVPIRTKPR
jgi:pilus assembly protein CpaB